EYYAQRATPGGLLIAEATPVMMAGRGNPGVPGIYSEAQIAGWRGVVDAVHAKGGLIFLQRWHVGRVSHSAFQPGGQSPVAPSAVPIMGEGMLAMTSDGKMVPYETPRALETEEVGQVVEAFRQAAVNAKAAGFDGVEIHGAHGYLLEQFLQSRTNLRTDKYGGSIENRLRLLMENTQAAPAGFTGGAGGAGLAAGRADAIAFGRIFISNPDLPRRLQHGFPLTPYNRATFYGGEAAGYTDYPVHDGMVTA